MSGGISFVIDKACMGTRFLAKIALIESLYRATVPRVSALLQFAG